MRPAVWPSPGREHRLLVIDAHKRSLEVLPIEKLAQVARPGDLWIVNDASTFPASLHGTVRGQAIEIRLFPNPLSQLEWPAVLLGEGNWRERTEERAAPPEVAVGDRIEIAGREVFVASVSELSSRHVSLRMAETIEKSWELVFRHGKPVQYSYLLDSLEMWDVQNVYSAAPWASEMPSAGRALNSETIANLRSRGIGIARVTHSTGLSSTGDPRIDSRAPLAEFTEISEETIAAIHAARARGGRIIAVGTSVARAIEGRAAQGELRAGSAWTSYVLSETTSPRWIDGILTGIHDVGESHFRLLAAFADSKLLSDAIELASQQQLQTHEFGDFSLVLR